MREDEGKGGGGGSMPLWIDVRWVEGVYGGRGWEGGVFDWESRTATQINREDVNWRASRRREQGLVNERVCLRERV